MYNAPMKSTPVTVNGGDFRSLSFGNGGGPSARYGCPDTLRLVVHDDRHSGSVVERPLCDREVAGSIPGRVIPKTLKMVLAALSLGAQH